MLNQRCQKSQKALNPNMKSFFTSKFFHPHFQSNRKGKKCTFTKIYYFIIIFLRKVHLARKQWASMCTCRHTLGQPWGTFWHCIGKPWTLFATHPKYALQKVPTLEPNSLEPICKPCHMPCLGHQKSTS